MKKREIMTAVQFMRKPAAFLTSGPDGWSLHFHDLEDPNERVLDYTLARGDLRLYPNVEPAMRHAREMGAWSLTITL